MLDSISGNSSIVDSFVLLTMISLLPSLLIVSTCFLRFVIVLSLVRQAIGLQQTPPNSVLISISIFMTLFVMQPVMEKIVEAAYLPYRDGQLNVDQALAAGMQPLKEFMIKNTRESDLTFAYGLASATVPDTVEEVEILYLIPAFLLSELYAAFKIGFMIFLPFLLIDLIVASMLMSMGMLMVPPMMMSLPLKILVFVLIDGWGLILGNIVRSIS